ncbi:hypothetical protein APUTEX25_005745, partial [Auxenochlorella protothecoides]
AAKSLGKTLRTFQPAIQELTQVSAELRSTLEREIGLDEVREDLRSVTRPRAPFKTLELDEDDRGVGEKRLASVGPPAAEEDVDIEAKRRASAELAWGKAGGQGGEGLTGSAADAVQGLTGTVADAVQNLTGSTSDAVQGLAQGSSSAVTEEARLAAEQLAATRESLVGSVARYYDLLPPEAQSLLGAGGSALLQAAQWTAQSPPAAAGALLLPTFLLWRATRGGFSGTLSAEDLAAALAAPGKGGILVVDIREAGTRASEGIPDLGDGEGCAAVALSVPTLDPGLVKKLADPQGVALRTLGLEIARLKALQRGTKLVILDSRAGGPGAAQPEAAGTREARREGAGTGSSRERPAAARPAGAGATPVVGTLDTVDVPEAPATTTAEAERGGAGSRVDQGGVESERAGSRQGGAAASLREGGRTSAGEAALAGDGAAPSKDPVLDPSKEVPTPEAAGNLDVPSNPRGSRTTSGEEGADKTAGH